MSDWPESERKNQTIAMPVTRPTMNVIVGFCPSGLESMLERFGSENENDGRENVRVLLFVLAGVVVDVVESDDEDEGEDDEGEDEEGCKLEQL